MRGGKRAGAGRKKGILTKARIAVQERARYAAAEGMSPLEYLLIIMRTHHDEAKRIDAAKAAAPFIHPRLAAVEHSGELNLNPHEERLRTLLPVTNAPDHVTTH